MAVAGQIGSAWPRFIPSLRWWIGGILFASTVINYIDRQTLSILAPYLKQEYHWTNTDYASIAIAFRIAYTIGQTACGRQMDRVGTRDRKSTRLNSSHLVISYAVFCLKKKKHPAQKYTQPGTAARALHVAATDVRGRLRLHHGDEFSFSGHDSKRQPHVCSDSGRRYDR